MSETKVKLAFSNEFSGTMTTKNGSFQVGGGENTLAPYDMLLGALGACFYATFIGIAQKMRLQYEGAEVSIRGVKREEVPTHLSEVEMVLTIMGAADQKGFQRASTLAAEYCSIHYTISKVCEIKVELQFGE